MKKLLLLSVLILLSISAFSQLEVKTNGQVLLDGGSGWFSQAPRAFINSNATTLASISSGFTLFNTNTTPNNVIRLQFGTYNDDSTEEDYVSLATQFANRSTTSKAADFHIATLNSGYFSSRFAIYNKNGDPNDVKLLFNTGLTGGGGTGRGVWIDDSGMGIPLLDQIKGTMVILGLITIHGMHYMFAPAILKRIQ